MSNKSSKGHGKNVTVRMSYRSSASGQFTTATTVGTSGVITRKSGSGKAIYASKAAYEEASEAEEGQGDDGGK